MANFLAQTEALAFGKTPQGGSGRGCARRRTSRTASFQGNRPTNTILAAELTPPVLGQLIALYEHKVFTQGTIWDINWFDQWGVELGKALASASCRELDRGAATALGHDSSTNALIRRYRACGASVPGGADPSPRGHSNAARDDRPGTDGRRTSCAGS